MNTAEVNLTRDFLDQYRDFASLEKEAFQQVELLQRRIDDTAYPSGAGRDEVRAQNPVPLSTILNGLISEQMEWEKKATLYRAKRQKIRGIIDNFSVRTRVVAERKFLDGISYKALGDEMGYSPITLRSSITRELERMEFTLF